MATKKPAIKKRSAIKKKPKVKKPVQSKQSSRKSASPKPIGKVIHFYGGIKVAVIKFNQIVRQGTKVHFLGATTDFSQKLVSMQYDHKKLAKAPKGKQVGVKVKSRVREGDKVYL